MNIVDESRFRPFGRGRAAPLGSVADAALAVRLAAYKRNVAGQYQSVPPDEIQSKVPPGVHIVSPKIDGEQWFIYSDGSGDALLLSPTGRAITGIPATDEAARIICGQRILVAGELFANGKPGRPRVQDVAAALGGGANAVTGHLKFAPFDLLHDGNEDTGRLPFSRRVERLRELFGRSERLCPVDFRHVDGVDAIAALFDEWVVSDGAEGIVVRCADGRILKIKPEINIDAAVVGFSEGGGGRIGRLLLALMRPDGKFQLIGSVGTGFTDDERAAFHRTLSCEISSAAYRKATPQGTLYHFVRPRIVVEVKCNDLLTHRSSGSVIRRMVLNYSNQNGWTPIRNVPAVSMINAVFMRIREDKTVEPVAVRFSQVTDIVPVEVTDDAAAISLPTPLIVRREVYSKTTGERTLIRKLVVWKTNRETADTLWPPYVAFFTDFAPGRKEPLKTDLRVASSLETMRTHIDEWLAANVKRGWNLVSDAITQPVPDEDTESLKTESGERKADTLEKESDISPFATEEITGNGTETTIEDSENIFASPPPLVASLSISFPRSSSANFAVAFRRAKTLAKFGSLEVENDDKGRQTRFTLTINSAIVENIVIIENLVRIVSRWRSTELSINGEPVSLFEFDSFLEEMSGLRRCLRRHGGKREQSGGHKCGTDSPLGCRRLRIEPNQKFLKFLNYSDMAWFAVGDFDGKTVRIDKRGLHAQVENTRNERLALCPLFDRGAVLRNIEKLPDVLDPVKDKRWVTVFYRDTGKPVWALPRKYTFVPHNLMLAPRENPANSILRSALSGAGESPKKDAASPRKIPSVRFCDVRGQDTAVEAVRDCVELPLRHAALFERVGVRGGGGILLYGPPGNGKTLLAKAVAGETSAHIEIVSGPEILSKWVGESERALRTVFERARHHAPSVILFDEIDAIAPARDAADAVHQKILVSQLLVLLDGLEARGHVFVIATTNRPGDIDSALLRPGRFDRHVFVGPPDAAGRAAIFEKYISSMHVSADVSPDDLAAATPGFSGAQIEYTCREAGLLCIKDAICTGAPTESIKILPCHFQEAIRSIKQPIGSQSHEVDGIAYASIRN